VDRPSLDRPRRHRPRALIAETIDVIAVIAGRGADRRLVELAQVRGLTATGDYDLTPAADTP
jgi:type IV secretion system protein VirB11